MPDGKPLPSRPYRLALVGGSGSGKSMISGLLSERGIPTLDTDRLVHGFYDDKNGAIPKALSAAFGEKILKDGRVDRPALRQIVFSDRASLAKLNRIVHGAVRRACEQWFSEQSRAGVRMAAVEAPQLFEAGMEEDFHAVIAVEAPEALRLSRILKRDGLSLGEAEKRLANQLTEEQYRVRAQYRLYNGGREDETARALDALLKQLFRKADELQNRK